MALNFYSPVCFDTETSDLILKNEPAPRKKIVDLAFEMDFDINYYLKQTCIDHGESIYHIFLGHAGIGGDEDGSAQTGSTGGQYQFSRGNTSAFIEQLAVQLEEHRDVTATVRSTRPMSLRYTDISATSDDLTVKAPDFEWNDDYGNAAVAYMVALMSGFTGVNGAAIGGIDEGFKVNTQNHAFLSNALVDYGAEASRGNMCDVETALADLAHHTTTLAAFNAAKAQYETMATRNVDILAFIKAKATAQSQLKIATIVFNQTPVGADVTAPQMAVGFEMLADGAIPGTVIATTGERFASEGMLTPGTAPDLSVVVHAAQAKSIKSGTGTDGFTFVVERGTGANDKWEIRASTWGDNTSQYDTNHMPRVGNLKVDVNGTATDFTGADTTDGRWNAMVVAAKALRTASEELDGAIDGVAADGTTTPPTPAVTSYDGLREAYIAGLNALATPAAGRHTGDDKGEGNFGMGLIGEPSATKFLQGNSKLWITSLLRDSISAGRRAPALENLDPGRMPAPCYRLELGEGDRWWLYFKIPFLNEDKQMRGTSNSSGTLPAIKNVTVAIILKQSAAASLHTSAQPSYGVAEHTAMRGTLAGYSCAVDFTPTDNVLVGTLVVQTNTGGESRSGTLRTALDADKPVSDIVINLPSGVTPLTGVSTLAITGVTDTVVCTGAKSIEGLVGVYTAAANRVNAAKAAVATKHNLLAKQMNAGVQNDQGRDYRVEVGMGHALDTSDNAVEVFVEDDDTKEDTQDAMEAYRAAQDLLEALHAKALSALTEVQERIQTRPTLTFDGSNDPTDTSTLIASETFSSTQSSNLPSLFSTSLDSSLAVTSTTAGKISSDTIHDMEKEVFPVRSSATTPAGIPIPYPA